MRRSRLRRSIARIAKHARQRFRPRRSARVCLVLGAQRSGTTLLLDALDVHPETRVHHEGDRAAYDDGFRLRPFAQRRGLAEAARCEVVVWKPLLDLQHADELLGVHRDARAIFLVRDPRDVALSSVAKWGDAMHDAVCRIAAGAEDHWLAERLPAARRQCLVDLDPKQLDAHSAAALRWWLRNELFFDLALDTRPDEVLPLRYERLVREPGPALAEVFGFLGLTEAPRLGRGISAERVGRGAAIELDPRVAELCHGLEARLDAVIAARGGA